MPYKCQACPARFNYYYGLEYHHEEHPDHEIPQFECQSCNRCFGTQNACNQHMNDTDHWRPMFDCETCNKSFYSQAETNQHMAQLSHWENYCKPCDRRFDNANNLKMHLNSRAHRGADFHCPFCKTGFTTASGLSHHLENNSCPKAKNLNRETIWKAIRARDKNGVLTNKQLTWHDECDGARLEVTNKTWNGSAWECYMCHKTFRTSGSLNAHVNSPAHKSDLYRCPNRSCSGVYKTLAAVFNHLESESCEFMRFEQVQNAAKNVITNSNRLISFD